MGDWLYLNYLQGLGRQDWRWFLLKPVYTFGVILTLYATVGCMKKSIRTCGGMTLLLNGNRIRFWLSECFFVFALTLMLVSISALISLLLFAIFGKASITTTSISTEYVRLWVDKEWSGYYPEIKKLLQETVLIPFLFSIMFSFFQLLLSLWGKSAWSYLLSVGLFLMVPFFPASYIGDEKTGIFDSTRTIWVIFGLIIGSICIVIIGALKIRKADLLGREE